MCWFASISGVFWSHACLKCCFCCCCCCGHRLCCASRPLLLLLLWPTVLVSLNHCCCCCCWSQENVRRTFTLMSQRGIVKPGDLVVVVTDMRPAEGDISRSVQVRRVQ